MGRHSIPSAERRVAISATLPAEIIKTIDRVAQERDVPRSVIIELALYQYLNRLYGITAMMGGEKS